MANPNIDYANTIFEYPILTKIHGIPTYESLRRIKNEIKANAASVYCDLGGGNHGHLGLIMSALEYAIISAVNYIRPIHPGILNIPIGTPNYEATRLTNEHKESVRLYREANNIEACLLRQISKALPDLYIKSFRNEYSNTFNTDLKTILQYLFTTYGYITPEELTEKKEVLCAKVFDIQQPLIIMFNELEELEQVAIAASNPYTSTQLVNIGIKLIKNFNDFDRGLTSWFERPIEQHTFSNFKSHFEREYQALRKVRGPTMKSAIYLQQANAIASVLKTIKSENMDILNEVKNSEGNIMRAMQMTQENFEREENDEREEPEEMQKLSHSVNSVTTDTIQLEILRLLKEMKESSSTKQYDKKKKTKDNERKNNKKNKKPQSDNTKKRSRYNTSKYCWSCGAGNHSSSDCNRRKSGHKSDATFQHMKKGCSDYCQIVTE